MIDVNKDRLRRYLRICIDEWISSFQQTQSPLFEERYLTEESIKRAMKDILDEDDSTYNRYPL